MNNNVKLISSLFLGASIFLLNACDNKNNNEVNKSSTNTVTDVTKDDESSNAQKESVKQDVNNKKDSIEQKEVEHELKNNEELNNSDKVISKGDIKSEVSDNVQETSMVKSPNSVENLKNNISAKKHEPKELKSPVKKVYYPKNERQALLHVLEKQYQQVKCTPEQADLGVNSFCHQEERRLFLEIQRVKDELR